MPWLTTYSLAKAAALDAFWKSLTVRGDDRDAGTLTMATIDAIEAFLSALRSAGWSARRGICGDTMDGFGGARLACDLPSGHASWHGCDNPGGTRCSWTHTDALTQPDVRSWDELRSSGLLWLINRVVFHPRGFALALIRRDGEFVGWQLLGDGREVWAMAPPEDDAFQRAQRTLGQPEGSPE